VPKTSGYRGIWERIPTFSVHIAENVGIRVSRAEHPRLAALGTSCPDHFLRTKVRPMVLDLPPTAPLEDVVARLGELHEAYRDGYRAYYERHATPESPAMRGAWTKSCHCRATAKQQQSRRFKH